MWSKVVQGENPNDASLFIHYGTQEITWHVYDKTTVLCETNLPKPLYPTLQTTKMNFEKLLG